MSSSTGTQGNGPPNYEAPSSGASTPNDNTGQSGGQSAGEAFGAGAHGRGRRNRQNRRNNQQGLMARGPKYKGKCEDIADFVYDAAAGGGNQDLFTNTTKEIAEYVAREYENAGEFRLALVNMELPDLTAPDPPGQNATLADIEIYKLDLKDHREKLKHRERNMGKIFPLILGQCSRTIRDRIEASPIWDEINANSNVMALLGLIRQSLYNRSTTKHGSHTLIDAYAELYEFKQGPRMTNSEYLEKLKALVEVVEHFGEEIGTSTPRVNQFLGEHEGDEPNADELAAAKAQAREEYIACMLIIKSDPRRYGDLVTDLENEFTRGSEGYPTTISKAYEARMRSWTNSVSCCTGR